MKAGTNVDERTRFDAFFPGRSDDVFRLLGAWSIPVALLDAGDRVLFWNRGAADFYGIGETDALGKAFHELVSETAAPALPAAGGRTRRYEARHRSFRDVDLPVMVTRTDLPAGDGTDGAFVLVTDLTESKALERRLARRVAQLSVIREIGECLQSAMSAERILRTILVGATASMGLRFNRAFLFLVDERHGVLRGRDAIGPADAAEALAIWSRLSAGARTLRDLVDEYEPVVDGEEPKVLEIARSLSARMDDASAFVVSALGARGTTRVAEGRVVSGATASPQGIVEVLGVDAFVAVPLEANGKPVGLLLADNAITCRAITDEDVNILELLALQAAQALTRGRLTEELARQVASLEAATREIRANQERMVRAERLTAIGEMAARVAHEIRNPLVAIGGFARSLLAGRSAQDPATRESLEIIVNEVRRLENIVKEVLEFSRPAPPRIGSVSLRRVAAEALELLRWELEHSAVIGRVEAEAETPPAAADGDQIFHAVVNLLRNAVHAMPRGGELVVKLRGVPHGVEMAIVDTGVGMPPDVLAHALEAFYTTKPHGSGLGLTIASQIVRDHGGEIRIDSCEGEGTTATLLLPAAEEGADA